MKKVFLIIAAVLVTLGIVLTGAAFAIGSFSFKSLDMGEVVTETATVDEAFSKIFSSVPSTETRALSAWSGKAGDSTSRSKTERSR